MGFEYHRIKQGKKGYTHEKTIDRALDGKCFNWRQPSGEAIADSLTSLQKKLDVDLKNISTLAVNFMDNVEFDSVIKTEEAAAKVKKKNNFKILCLSLGGTVDLHQGDCQQHQSGGPGPSKRQRECRSE